MQKMEISRGGVEWEALIFLQSPLREGESPYACISRPVARPGRCKASGEETDDLLKAEWSSSHSHLLRRRRFLQRNPLSGIKPRMTTE